MTASVASVISANVSTAFSALLASNVDKARTLISKAGGAQIALSAYLRTGKKDSATIGALSFVWGGVRELLADGNNTKLRGFATASKKDSPALNVLTNLGICTQSGAIIGAVEAGFKNSEAEKNWHENLPYFVALFEAEKTRISDAKKAEAKKATTEAEAEAEAEATTEETRTPGQIDNDAVQHLMTRFQAGQLSSENVDAILAIFAPYGVKAAPRTRKTTTA